MNWLKIIIAALFEVGWVVGLTHASNTIEWFGTVIAIFFKFLFINTSVESITSWNDICDICWSWYYRGYFM
jgi:multidrug transporter EmrE-like cation transporter